MAKGAKDRREYATHFYLFRIKYSPYVALKVALNLCGLHLFPVDMTVVS